MRKAKDEDEKGLTRLHNIVVQEVSLVDRAANQRRFLVTKRNEDMKLKLIPDGKGGYIEKADDTKDDDDAKKAKAAEEKEEETKKAKADAKEKEEDAKKAKADADEKEEEAKKAKADAKEKEEDAKKAKAKAEGDEEDDDEDKDDDADKTKKRQLAMLVTTAEAFTKVAEVLNKGGELPETFFTDMASNLGKIAGGGDKDAKAKAKIDELTKELAKLKAGEADDDDEKAKKAKAKEEEDAKNAKPSKTEKALLTKLEEIGETVTKQADEIRKLKDEPGEGNGIVEKGNGGTAADAEAWPLDMAGDDKISKASAEKRGVSFYG